MTSLFLILLMMVTGCISVDRLEGPGHHIAEDDSACDGELIELTARPIAEIEENLRLSDHEFQIEGRTVSIVSHFVRPGLGADMRLDLTLCVRDDNDIDIKGIAWQRHRLSSVARFDSSKISHQGHLPTLVFSEESDRVSVSAIGPASAFGSAPTVLIHKGERDDWGPYLLATVGSSEFDPETNRFVFTSFDMFTFPITLSVGRSISPLDCPPGFSPNEPSVIERFNVKLEFETCTGQGGGNSSVSHPISVKITDQSGFAPEEYRHGVTVSGEDVEEVFIIDNSHHNWCDSWTVRVPHATYRSRKLNRDHNCNAPSCGSILTFEYRDGHSKEHRSGCMAER